MQRRASVGGQQVDHHAALAPIQCMERLTLTRRELANAPRAFAAGRLQLDHFGAKVGECDSAVGASDDLGQFQHLDAIEWSRHGIAFPDCLHACSLREHWP